MLSSTLFFSLPFYVFSFCYTHPLPAPGLFVSSLLDFTQESLRVKATLEWE